MHLRTALRAGIAYIVLAILQTYPLVRHLSTHLPGEGLGDNVSFVWNLWWMREALVSPSLSFFETTAMFAPMGAPLVLHTHTAAAAWVGATVLSSLTLVTAQNVLLIGFLALNGWSAYLLARALTGDDRASFIAGALFLLSPVVAGRLMGHYNLVAAFPLALACLALVEWWRRPDWQTGLVLGAAAGLLPFFDYYYSVFFAAFTVTYAAAARLTLELRRQVRSSRSVTIAAGLLSLAALALAVAIASSSRDALDVWGLQISARTPTNALTAAWLLGLLAWVWCWRWQVALRRRASAGPRHLIRAVALPLIVAATVIAPLVGPAWRLWREGGYTTQQSGVRSGPRGIDPATAFLGPPYSGVVGRSVRGVYSRFDIDPMESAAWLGWGTLLLAGLAWRERDRNPDVRRWFIVLTVFSLWALGPYLVVLGRNTGLILPGALLRLVPIINNARIPGRALVMVALCASVLAACALVAMRQRRRTGLATGLVFLAALESIAAPLPLAALPPAGVYGQVASDASGGAVLPVPFGIRDGFGKQGRVEHDAIYQQTVHRHPLVGGFLARLPPEIDTWYMANEPYASLLQLSEGGDARGSVTCESARRGLEAARVTFVVLYVADASDALRQFVESSLPVERVADDGSRRLFRVTGCR